VQNLLFGLFSDLEGLVLWQMENSLLLLLLGLLQHLAVVVEPVERAGESRFKVFRLLKVLLVYVIVRKIHLVEGIFLFIFFFEHAVLGVLIVFELAVEIGSEVGALHEVLIGVNLALRHLLLRRQAARNTQSLGESGGVS
jgi:hypothetical protein